MRIGAGHVLFDGADRDPQLLADLCMRQVVKMIERDCLRRSRSRFDAVAKT